MDLTFYGVRGSYPIARRDQVRYGGNTTCLHFTTRSGENLILDGGSGIRLLGDRLMRQTFGRGQGAASILVTHTHWDHILGFPFFPPFYRQGNRFVLASAGQTGSHIRDILAGQHADLNFPVPFEDLVADVDYIAFEPGEPLELGEFHIETVQLNHPGITVGYRVEADDCAVTVFSDTGRVSQVRIGAAMGGPEPDKAYTHRYLAELAHCARNSDLLVHDAQYFEYQMVGRYHWGHSTVEDALQMARMAGVKKLALFHFDPNHSDTVVDEQLALARDLSAGDSFEIVAAVEGWQIQISSGDSSL
jgi:ribonuclease BN (tRNA processing enzyme)